MQAMQAVNRHKLLNLADLLFCWYLAYALFTNNLISPLLLLSVLLAPIFLMRSQKSNALAANLYDSLQGYLENPKNWLITTAWGIIVFYALLKLTTFTLLFFYSHRLLCINSCSDEYWFSGIVSGFLISSFIGGLLAALVGFRNIVLGIFISGIYLYIVVAVGLLSDKYYWLFVSLGVAINLISASAFSFGIFARSSSLLFVANMINVKHGIKMIPHNWDLTISRLSIQSVSSHFSFAPKLHNSFFHELSPQTHIYRIFNHDSFMMKIICLSQFLILSGFANFSVIVIKSTSWLWWPLKLLTMENPSIEQTTNKSLNRKELISRHAYWSGFFKSKTGVFVFIALCLMLLFVLSPTLVENTIKLQLDKGEVISFFLDPLRKIKINSFLFFSTLSFVLTAAIYVSLSALFLEHYKEKTIEEIDKAGDDSEIAKRFLRRMKQLNFLKFNILNFFIVLYIFAVLMFVARLIAPEVIEAVFHAWFIGG